MRDLRDLKVSRDTKERRRCMNYYDLYDYQGVESHLTEMAAKGWYLEKTGPRFWTYRKGESADVRYAVTYIPDASQFNPGPTEGQQSLMELCAAAGWEKVCDWYQMQIFFTRSAEPLPLENDEALRLQVIHRSMKRNFLPGNLVLLLVSLLMAVLWGKTIITDPIRLFRSNAYLFTGTLWVLSIAALAISLGSYWRWYRRSSRSTSQGGPCAPVGRLPRWTARALLAAVGIYCVVYVLSEYLTSDRRALVFLAVYFSLFLLLGLLVRGTTAFLRRRGASWGKNLAGTLAADVVLAFVLVGGLIFLVIRLDWFGQDGETYTLDHLEWDVSPVEIPLTVSDLTGRQYDHISRRAYRSGSLFLTQRDYHERVLAEGEQGFESISYEITEVNSPWLYQKVVEDLTREEIASPWDITWKETAPRTLGAEAVYQRYLDGEPSRRFVLCYPGRVVEFSPDEEPAEAQMEMVGRKLCP